MRVLWKKNYPPVRGFYYYGSFSQIPQQEPSSLPEAQLQPKAGKAELGSKRISSFRNIFCVCMMGGFRVKDGLGFGGFRV